MVALKAECTPEKYFWVQSEFRGNLQNAIARRVFCAEAISAGKDGDCFASLAMTNPPFSPKPSFVNGNQYSTQMPRIFRVFTDKRYRKSVEINFIRAIRVLFFAMLLLFSVIFSVPAVAQSPQNIFVSVSGSDTAGDGSIGNPFRTLYQAGRAAQPGDTIFVRGGVYSTAKDKLYYVYGTANLPITVRPYNSETVIFDGAGAIIDRTQSVILIGESSHVVFDGFEVRNSTGRGISVYNSTVITVRNNRVHDVQARGISASGDHITIENNEIWNAVLENTNEAKGYAGWSSALSTNERPDGSWSTDITIRGNIVHDSWGEGITPGHAQFVRIDGNTVFNTYSVNIYLNLVLNVTVDGNYLYATSEVYNRTDHGYPAHGISIANEQPVPGGGAFIRDVTISNNIIVGTGRGINYWQTGLNAAENTYADVSIFYNTVIYSRHDAIHFDPVDGSHIAPNGVFFQNNIVLNGANGVAANIGNPAGWTITHNDWPDGIPAVASGAGNIAVDPQFHSAVIGHGTGGFTVPLTSPVVGAGVPVTTLTDFAGNFRANPPTLGAFEANPPILDKRVFLPLVVR